MTSVEQPELVTDCEVEWVKIKLQHLTDLYVGTFYMPHRNAHDLKELQKSLNLVTNNGNSQPHILFVGDFNCPDIN